MAGDGLGGDRTYIPDARTGECPEGMRAVYPLGGPTTGICIPIEPDTPDEEDFESAEVDEEEREELRDSMRDSYDAWLGETLFGGESNPTTPGLCAEPPPPDEMPACIRDSSAPKQDWSISDEAFLNPNNCQYYIPVTTDYECPGAEQLEERVFESIPSGIDSLFNFLGKEAEDDPNGPLKRNILDEYVRVRTTEAYEYEKAPRDNLRVLYKWPFYFISALNLFDSISATPNNTTGDSFTAFVPVENLLGNISKLARTLKKLTYQQIFAAADGRYALLQEGSTLEISLKQEVEQVLSLKSALDKLLRGNNFIFPSPLARPSRSPVALPEEKKIVHELLIAYDANYSITSIFAKSIDSQYERLKTSDLPPSSVLRNPTVVSYLTALPQIVREIDTPKGLSINELVESYHYPKLIKVGPNATNTAIAGCDVGAAISDRAGAAAKSILLQEVSSLLGNFATGLKKYACMDEESVRDRNTELIEKLEEFSDTLKGQMESQISGADGLVSDLDKIVDQINGIDKKAIQASWAAVFDQLTTCGMINLVQGNLKDIMKTDVCGIDPANALKGLITKLLKDNPKSLEDLWNLLGAGIQQLVEGPYQTSVRATLSDAGYQGGGTFPWEVSQSLEEDTGRDLLGINFYNTSVFLTGRNRAGNNEDPELTAFLQGYNYNFGVYDAGNMSQTEEYSFWLGFIEATTELIQTGSRSDNPVFIRPAFIPQANQRFVTEMATMDRVNTEFVDLLVLHTPLSELIEKIKNVPVIGQGLNSVLESVPEVTKCIVNDNLNDIFGKSIDAAQNNLSSLAAGGDLDFCSFEAPTMPNISSMMKQNVSTLWSAILDAIIDALMTMLLGLILKLSVQMLKIIVSGFQGGLCDRPGILAEAVSGQLPASLSETFDLAGSFEEAFCGDAVPNAAALGAAAPGGSSGADSRLTDILGSLTGLPPEQAASILSGDSNIIDALSARLRADQFLDLLQGTPSDGVVSIVLDLVRSQNVELAGILTDAASVRNFFRQLGDSFPAEYLQSLRDSLAIANNRDLVDTICDITPSQARENLADALRNECGDQITEEQIQDQLDRFEQRAVDILENLASMLTGGSSASMENSFRTMIEENLPKDDPANLIIAEEIASIMFDPLYPVYANDLMSPMDIMKNGGFLNLVLSNINAVPQRGQIANSRMAYPLLGPAANDIFFDFTSDTIPPQGPSFPLNPGPVNPDRLKPYSVARSLKNEFAAVGDEGGIYTPGPNGFELLFNRPGTEVMLFNVVFAGSVGQLNLAYDSEYLGRESIQISYPLDYGAAFDGHMQAVQSFTLAALQRFLDRATVLPGQRSPPNIGAATLTMAAFSAGFTGVDTGASFGEEAMAEYDILRQVMRKNIVASLGRNIKGKGSGDLAFSYGSYHIEPLSNTQILGTTAPPPGYEVLGLPDGRIVITPPPKGGWLQIKDILLGTPDEEFCCDDSPKASLFDMEQIRDKVVESYKNTVDDPRLNYNPRTISEPPYSRILGRMNLASMEGVVVTTLQTYIIEYFLKGAATFTRFKTDKEVFGTGVLATYLAEKVRIGLRSQKPNPAAPSFPRGAIGESYKLYAYWYEFLEQACQIVSRRVKDGRIYVESNELNNAMESLQTAMEGYEYPGLEQLREERQARGNYTIRLKNFRQKNKIDFIQETESAAMVVLKYLIIDELDEIAAKVENIFPHQEPYTRSEWWISNYSQLMEQSFFLATRSSLEGERGFVNISEVSRVVYDSSGTATKLDRILPGFSLSLLRAPGYTNLLAEGIPFLECYLRPTVKDEEVETLSEGDPASSIISGDIYGLREFVLRLEGRGITDSETLSTYFSKIKYGLRLSYMLPENAEDITPQLIDRMRSGAGVPEPDVANRYFKQSAWVSTPSPGGRPNVGRYTTPILYSAELEEEIPPLFLNIQLSAFSLAVGPGAYSASVRDTGTFNWSILWERMINHPRFRLMFNYSIQTQHILSALAIYNMEGFLDSIGVDDDWNYATPKPLNNYLNWNKKAFVGLRRQLKKMFKEVYNSQDFMYRDEPLGASEARQVENVRTESNVDQSLGGNLAPGLTERIVFGPIACPEDEE